MGIERERNAPTDTMKCFASFLTRRASGQGPGVRLSTEDDVEHHVLTTPEIEDRGGAVRVSGDTDGEDGLFTKDNLPTLVAFFLFVFSSGAFMSLITPFLPLVLTKCGADSVLIGLVFAAYPFANICAVPLSTKLCSVLGRSKAFVFGAALEALFGILFGYAHLFAGSSLKYFYLLIRFIQGFGSSIAYTALIGWVSTRVRERLASVLGFQEAIGGVGLMLGPSLGGLLYGLAGISLPLVIFSVLVLVSIPPLFLSMGADEAPEAVEPDAESIAEDLTVSDLVNVSTVNATVVTLIAAIGFGFINQSPRFTSGMC